jgi:Tfp pilus assembly protein PilN
MAQINLYKKATSKQNFFKSLFILCVLILEVIIFSVLSKSYSSTIENLLSEKQTLEANEKKIKEKILSLKNDIQTYKIKHSQTPFSPPTLHSSVDALEILALTAHSLPSKSWLTSMKLESTDFFIQGQTLASSIVSSYLNLLSDTKKFKKVELLFLKTSANSSLKNFSIKCKLPHKIS